MIRLQSRNSYIGDWEIVALSNSEFLSKKSKPLSFVEFTVAEKSLLRGIMIAMYIVGQERRLVDPPSQVVAGVRTVTTKMDGRCDPHVAAPIRFLGALLTSLSSRKSLGKFDSGSHFGVDSWLLDDRAFRDPILDEKLSRRGCGYVSGRRQLRLSSGF